MQNVKKILFYSIIIFSIERYPCSHAEGLKAEARIFTDGVSNALIEMGKFFGLETAEKLAPKVAELADNGRKTIEKAGQSLENASENVGLAASGVWAPVVNNGVNVLGAAVGIWGSWKLYTAATEIYRYNHPSEEEQARENEAAEKNKLFKAKHEFRTCLMDKAPTERNLSGLPTACEEVARMFGMIAGASELNNMATNFKNVYKE